MSQKLRAFIADLTPATVFNLTFFTSVIIALAATIIYRTASESLHANISPINTAKVVLEGSHDLGGIEPGGFVPVEWEVRNQPTKPAFVIIKVGANTSNLYEVVGSEQGCTPGGW